MTLIPFEKKDFSNPYDNEQCESRFKRLKIIMGYIILCYPF